MIVSVIGKNNHIKKNEVKDFVCRVLELIAGKRLTNNLDVTVKFAKLSDDVAGYTEWVDNNIRPREFVIAISNKLSRRKQFKTMAHELVHVKQFAKGELVERLKPTQSLVWKKDKPLTISRNEEEKQTMASYLLLPWEIEANGMEEALVTKYTEDTGTIV